MKKLRHELIKLSMMVNLILTNTPSKPSYCHYEKDIYNRV